jgi:hypothetical protein
MLLGVNNNNETTQMMITKMRMRAKMTITIKTIAILKLMSECAASKKIDRATTLTNRIISSTTTHFDHSNTISFVD